MASTLHASFSSPYIGIGSKVTALRRKFRVHQGRSTGLGTLRLQTALHPVISSRVPAIVCGKFGHLNDKSKSGAKSARQDVKYSAIAVMGEPIVEAQAVKNVLIPIGSGSEEMEAVILVDVLRRAGADVIVASVEKDLQIEASRKVKLVADKVIEKCADQVFDLIVLPGGMPGAERLRDCEVLQQITTHHAREGRPYAAICAAPAVALLPWGLLGGLLATAHPAFVNKLPEKSAAEERVVTDGMLTTSRGPGTAFELALALVERLYGVHRAHEVAAPMVMWQEDARGMWSSHIGEGNVSSSRDHPPQVLLPIANGSEEMEAVIITDVLRRAGALVVIASVEEETGLEITASRGVHIVADAMISDVKDTAFDLVVLPGGMPGAQRLASCDTLDALLKDHVTSNRLCAAICAAPSVVLHAKGLLWNKKATAHPAFSDTLMDQTAVAARVVHDGGMVTSRGPGTAMEFALYLVECLFGPEKAAQVAEPMVLKPALTRFPGA